ncbi:hypothetical protein EDB92DRAFT_1822172 [Lactarius akahatsu]|uniref:DUF6532 domain-containing protein n=1 Tax=Lactarius akahatsu TaxID=416441 RepID=A0AAD4Q7K4_9AGAM|nr:hypothetical protein EDB92DRAFT_1822172 [Lactarius akahatsu]
MAPQTRKSQRLLRNQALEGSNESHTSLDHSMHTNMTNEVRVVSQNTNVQHIGDPTPPQGDLIGKGKRTFASLNDSPGIPATVQPTPTSAAKKVWNVDQMIYQTDVQRSSSWSSYRSVILKHCEIGFRARDSKLAEVIAMPFLHQLIPKQMPLDHTFKIYKPNTKRHKKIAGQPAVNTGPMQLQLTSKKPALRPTYWDQDPYPTTEEDSTDDDNLAALTQGDPSKLQKVMASEIPSWLDPALGARRCPSVSNTVGTGTSNMSLGNNIYTMLPPVLAETTSPTQPCQDQAQAATGTESTSAWPANTNLLFAPGMTRVLLARQRQLICDIVWLTVNDLWATLIFNNTFPDGILATCFIRSSLNTAAKKVVKKKPAASSIQERLLADDDYVLKIAPVLRTRIPLFCSEVKDRCNSIVLAEYTSKVPADIIRSVDWQLSGYNYVHPKGPKCNATTGVSPTWTAKGRS